jgi:DNA-binding MarR family transcriptional regulator
MVSKLDLKGTRGCAAFNLRRTSRAVTQIYDAALRESGLRSTQFGILVTLARLQPASVRALADTTLMDATTMTRNLKLMKLAGLVEITPRRERREKHVRLSNKGQRALARSVPLWRAAQIEFERKLGNEEWSVLRRQLERVADLQGE